MPEQQQSNNSPLVSGDTIAGGVMGILGTAINNLSARKRESDARMENYEYNEKAAENAYQRQLNYYDTRMSPAALLAQYREAGLSPSLMFGGGGVGGGTATAPQGQGSSGVSPNVFGMNLLESAQVGLMQAQTRKLNAEADTEAGINERGQAEISNVLQDTATKLSQMHLNESAECVNVAEERIKNVDALLKENTLDDNISLVNYNLQIAKHNSQKALYEAGKAEIDFTIATQTQKDVIQQIKDRTIKQLEEILQIREERYLTNKQWRALEESIYQKWDEIETHKWNAVTYADFVKNLKEYWEGTLGQQEKNRQTAERGQNMQMWNTVINAGTAVIESGMNQAGNYMMGQQGYTITHEHYNPNGSSKGWTVTKKNK